MPTFSYSRRAERSYQAPPELLDPPVAYTEPQVTDDLPPAFEFIEMHPVVPVQDFPTDMPESLTMTPVFVKCTHCGKNTLTNVSTRFGPATIALCGVLTIFCAGPFAFVAEGSKDIVHRCNECRKVLGIRSGLDPL
jgi:hypothetical protein